MGGASLRNAKYFSTPPPDGALSRQRLGERGFERKKAL
jgi:hypothetical protein